MDTKRPRTITMAEVMTPDMANFGGNIHGGHLMQFFDKVAYACAAQYCQSYVVTLSVDQIFFKNPIHVGDLLTCFASVNYVGNTSLEIGIRAEAKNLISGEKRHTNSCYFTMVSMDANNKPQRIPAFIPGNEIEKNRFEKAKARKEFRLEYYQKHHK